MRQSMTLNRFIKQLQKLADDGYGRATVAVHKTTFVHNLEGDGCCIIDVSGVRAEAVPQLDGDGGIDIDSKGRERTKRTAVIYGPSWDPTPSERRRA